jgi:TetR/AcrR family transcriptional regulator, transcriptional repressor for nem operon
MTAAPSTRKGRATRDRIVDAACDLVFEHGVAALNLDDVREATGTSKSQLYHYFENKTDLIKAVVHRQAERVLEIHGSALGVVDGWAALGRWRNLVVRLVRDAGCHGGCPIGSLANELAELDEPSRLHLSEVFAEWEGMLAAAMQRMVDSGQLSASADIKRLSIATLASLQGGLLLSKTDRSVKPLEVALDSAFDYLKAVAAPV